MENKELAEKLVNQSMKIGRKKNPGIKKAEEKYGKEKIQEIRTNPEKTNEEMKKELSDVDYGPLIHESNGEIKAKEKVGHTVMISCHKDNRELARQVEKKCLKNGAHTLLLEKNTERMKEKYVLPPEDTLKELPEISKSFASEIDYAITIEPAERTKWKENVPEKKLSAHSPVKQRLYNIRDRNEVRWAYVGWPHPGIAKDLGITKEKFERVLNASLEESFKQEMLDIIQTYHELMSGSSEVRIESEEGTEFFLNVEGRHFLKDDGILTEEDIERGDIGMNFPCGEVFVAPVEDSAEGRVFVPKSSLSSYGTVEGIWLEFENGAIVDYSAEKNEEYLERFFKENTGEIKRIAELGIGCNKAAEYTDGYILIDEKIFGTIHFAIGWNVGYGGKNQASAHHDFIKPMEKGKMYADDKLVMDNGKPVK